MQYDRYQQVVIDDVLTGSGNVVVQARAGAGKTSVIVESARRLGDSRGRVLMCAFNKEIQAELQRRAPDWVEVRTLHSIGMKTLTRYWGGSNFKVSNRKGWGITYRVLKRAPCYGNSKVRGDLQKYANKLYRLQSLAKNSLVGSIAEIESLAHRHGIGDVYMSVPEASQLAAMCMKLASQETEEIDFDDMLYLPAKIGCSPDQYDYVFVDELQDINPAQLDLIKKSVEYSGRIIAIGDPKQALYSWRGADRNTISNFIQELRARTLPMSVTYRCATKVVEHVQNWVPDLEAMPGAREGEVELVDEDRFFGPFGPRAGDYVLSRLNAPLMQICMHLLRHRIPAVVVGKDTSRDLVNLVNESGATTVIDLELWMSRRLKESADAIVAEESEVARLDMQEAYDRMEDETNCIRAVADGEKWVSEVIDHLNAMFVDDQDDSHMQNVVCCSTVHRAKGHERDRVWLLLKTFAPESEATDEERNIYYVAATRARESLYLYDGALTPPEDE